MKKISIFTPIFNRSYIIKRLYDSLVAQTNKNFEWIVVDDGSIDNISKLINDYKQEGLISIKFFQQSNQGKHIAINKGVELSEAELFFIVDSDDCLKENAVQRINDFWTTCKENRDLDTISGIISYREFPTGQLVGSKLPDDVKRCKLRDCSSKYNSRGDKVVIYKTEILRQHKYPKFATEVFLGESYVFNQIDDKYDMLVLDDTFYIFDYQADGLSQKFRKLYRENPKGFLACYEQQIKYVTTRNDRRRCLAHIICLSIKEKRVWTTYQSYKELLSIYSLLAGLYLYIKIFIFKSNDVKPYYG